jgi:hypothetical protein
MISVEDSGATLGFVADVGALPHPIVIAAITNTLTRCMTMVIPLLATQAFLQTS